MNKTIIFQELIKNQRKNIITDKKLSLSDLKRLSLYLSNSIFTNKCSLWEGYVTEIKNTNAFVNFFFNGKKQALHRLLYNNFVDDVNENEYLRFNCENKGQCCSISHICLLKKKIENVIEDDKLESIKPEDSLINEISETNKSKKTIIIEF
jgi:hypothetical protein